MRDADLLDLAASVNDALWWADVACHTAATLLLKSDRWADLAEAAARLEDARERLAKALDPVAGAVKAERRKLRAKP